jgi:hypothetical protein
MTSKPKKSYWENEKLTKQAAASVADATTAGLNR